MKFSWATLIACRTKSLQLKKGWLEELLSVLWNQNISIGWPYTVIGINILYKLVNLFVQEFQQRADIIRKSKDFTEKLWTRG